MSVSKLPSGRYRAQTYNPATKRFESSAKILGLEEPTFATRREAQKVDVKAAEVLAARKPQALSLRAFADRWLSDPLFERRKESTQIHNEERIRRFVAKYGDLPLDAVGDDVVAEWLAGGANKSTVPVLKAMFNDAASAKAGRLVSTNPFAGLKLSKGRGRADEDPPTELQVAEMVQHARQVTSQGFAAWLEVAAWSGMRPGELDALRWDRVDFAASRVQVVEQWNVKARKFSTPKNDLRREILLTPQARNVLLALPKTSEFCFVNLRGQHWTPSARSHHWDRVRVLMGWLELESRKSLYLATRHFCGWYLYNVLELPAEDVAIQLGHEDGGELVRRLYGHRDRARTLARISDAFDRTGEVRPLRLAKGDTA